LTRAHTTPVPARALARGVFLVLAATALCTGSGSAQEEGPPDRPEAVAAPDGAPRIPPPEFESDYEIPDLRFQRRRRRAWQIVDTAALAAAMGLGAWLLLKRRSRTGVFVLGLASLLYFGFYKKGCICPVGGIQNVTLALAGSSYAIPVTVVVVFLLPLVAALVVGRVFCGSACALGLIQDYLLFKPVQVPRWLGRALSLVRYFILGVVVYFAATAGRFVMCEFDPFVGFFRRNGEWYMFLAGGGLLVLGMFVGRPFCRFLCPYGAVLSVAARWPSYGVRITPDECIKCSLCGEACPFGAIERPRSAYRAPRRTRAILWASAAAVVPALAAAGWWAAGGFAGGALGAWVGLVVSAKLVSLGASPERKEYEVDHAECFSCGRCYTSCPHERRRLKTIAEAGEEKAPQTMQPAQTARTGGAS